MEATPAPEAESSPGRSWFRGDVDGLRAIAIILVVAYHVGLPGFGGGFIGVDVFFVISGFLISRNLLREADGHERVALASFWARRIRRLVPALALMIVATLVVGYFVFPLYRDGRPSPARGPRRPCTCRTSSSPARRRATSAGTSTRARSCTPGRWGWRSSSTCCGRCCSRWCAGRRGGPLSRRITNYRRKALIAVFAVTLVVSLGIDVMLTNQRLDLGVLRAAVPGLGVRRRRAAGRDPGAHACCGPWAARTLLAVAGLVVLVVGLVLIRGTTPYPGLWALLPVVATMALITAGHTWEGEVAANPINAGLTNRSGAVAGSGVVLVVPVALAGHRVDRGRVQLQQRGPRVAWPPCGPWAWRGWPTTTTRRPIRFQPVLTRSNTRTFVFGAVVTALVLAVCFVVTPDTPTVPAAGRAGPHRRQPPSPRRVVAPAADQPSPSASTGSRSLHRVPEHRRQRPRDGDKYCIGGDVNSPTHPHADRRLPHGAVASGVRAAGQGRTTSS